MPSLCSTILDRLRSELKWKLALAVMLNLWVYLPYSFLQHHHYFLPIAMPASACDRLIQFNDQAVWIYLSIYLLIPVGPFLMSDRRQIARYVIGVVLIGMLADVVFVFWPTQCPRPDAGGTVAAYRTLVAIDNSFHAFPSLHAAFAIFSAFCAGRVLRGLRKSFLWQGLIWLWALAILFATLQTKQHMVADIVAGSLLGGCAYFCAFLWPNPRTKTKLPFQPMTQPAPQSDPNNP